MTTDGIGAIQLFVQIIGKHRTEWFFVIFENPDTLSVLPWLMFKRKVSCITNVYDDIICREYTKEFRR